jgi:mannitol/fructose-specific phosphotransferase system IIA component (Ntr-type)
LDLKDWTSKDAIVSLAKALASASGLPADQIVAEVWKREQLSATGIGNWVAVPHARIPGLNRSWVAVGVSDYGIDFDAPDGRSVRLIFLVISPMGDHETQLELLSDIARSFEDVNLRDACLKVKNYTEFLGLVKSSVPAGERV